MSRIQGLLILVLMIEAGVGAALYFRREPPPPLPPIPQLSESDSALPDFRELAANCRTTEDWRQFAETCVAYGCYAEADACLEHLLSLRPKDPDALFDSAFLLSRMGRLDASNRRFSEAIDAGHSEPVECWYFIGRNHLRAEAPDKAAAAFAQASELPAAHLELARIHYRAGDARQALESLRPVFTAAPETIEPNLLAYQCHVLLGEPTRAAEFAERAADTSKPGFTPFITQWLRYHKAIPRAGFRKRLDQGESWIRQKRYDLAESALAEAVHLQWDEPVANRLADLATLRGDHQVAVKLLREIVDRRGPSSARYERLADGYANLRDWKRAVETLELALQTRSRDDMRGVYQKLADWSQQLGRDADARRYSGLHRLWSGKFAFWSADWANAETELNAAATRLKTSADAWFFLAETQRRLQKPQQSRAAYRRCLAIDPRHGRAARGLAILDGHRGAPSN